MKYLFFVLLLTFSLLTINAQTNQFDNTGKRHGVWVKKFKNGNIRYQGKFDHGKEIGIFKYYSLESTKNPIIVKTFNSDDNYAQVSFYTPTGRLISKGKMENKNRIGQWLYFHKDGITILQDEFYINGELNGKYNTYFSNKKPTIEANYKNDVLDGSYKRYSVRGHIYQDLNYKNGVLDGAVVYYDRLSGDLIKKGFCKNDKKVGVWEYFYKGELIETKNFSEKKKRK